MYLAGKKRSLIQPITIWIWLRGKSDLPQSQRCVKTSRLIKELKAHCYKVAESAWKLLNIDTLITKSLVDAEKEEKETAEVKPEKETKAKGKETAKPTAKVETEEAQVQVLAEVA